MKDWYDDFLDELNDMESNSPCPQCNKTGLVHSNPFGYDFICPECQESFTLEGKFSKELTEFDNEKE